MTQSKVKIKIMIRGVDPDGKLTKDDQWDVITACVVAARAAIEQYVSASQRQNACDAMARVLRGPLPVAAKYRETVVVSPFEEEEEA